MHFIRSGHGGFSDNKSFTCLVGKIMFSLRTNVCTIIDFTRKFRNWRIKSLTMRTRYSRCSAPYFKISFLSIPFLVGKNYFVPWSGKARSSVLFIFSNTIELRIFYATLPRSRCRNFVNYYCRRISVSDDDRMIGLTVWVTNL